MDNWGAGRPNSGSGTLKLSGTTPHVWKVDADLWQFSESGGGDDPETNVHVKGKVSCPA